mgnify:CR=1 FL=1
MTVPDPLPYAHAHFAPESIPLKILLSGHGSCHNRGCEAIVRTTAAILARRWPRARLRLPSQTPGHDAQVLADATLPIQTEPQPRPMAARVLSRLQHRGWLHSDHHTWPLPVPPAWRRQLAGVDAVLAIGGDNYTLDYGIPTAIAGLDHCARRMGIPVVLWGASVGPFDARPAYGHALMHTLSRFTAIGARESHTADLLRAAGLEPVESVPDPAFDLPAEPWEDPALETHMEGARRIIALNLSPLVAARTGSGFHQEAARLLHQLSAEPGSRVVFIPHVAHPHDPDRGDHAVHEAVLRHAALPEAQQRRIHLLPPTCRAGQYKAVVARCHALVAARTHLTIAAFSSGIPAVALGYSQKAAGLDADLYGGQGLHLDAAAFSAEAVLERLQRAESQGSRLCQRAAAAIAARRPGTEALLDRLQAAVRAPGRDPATA